MNKNIKLDDTKKLIQMDININNQINDNVMFNSQLNQTNPLNLIRNSTIKSNHNNIYNYPNNSRSNINYTNNINNYFNSSNNLNHINLNNKNDEISLNNDNIMDEFSNSFSLVNNNLFKEKYKLLNKTKISLETELEFVKSENNNNKEQIIKMKQKISELIKKYREKAKEACGYNR